MMHPNKDRLRLDKGLRRTIKLNLSKDFNQKAIILSIGSQRDHPQTQTDKSESIRRQIMLVLLINSLRLI
jgi:hypothetical protein